MASALETRDHFRDVSNDGVPQVQQFTQAQPRQNRLPSLDNASSLTFGSTFGVGKSMWNSTSNIWRSSSKFVDGASDDGATRGMVSLPRSILWLNRDSEVQSQSSQLETLTPNKTGSKSLLSSSESEAPSGRKNTPWGASVNTHHAFVSRSQDQNISPLRPRQGDVLGGAQRLGQTTAPNSNTISPIHGSFHQFSNGPQPGNGLRHPLNMAPMAEHLQAVDNGQLISNSNYAAFHIYGVSNLAPNTRNLQDSSNNFRNTFDKNHDSSTGFNTRFSEAPNTGPYHSASYRGDYDIDSTSQAYGARVVENCNGQRFEKDLSASQFPYQSHEERSGLRQAYQRHATSMQAHDTGDERGSAPSSARSETFQSYGNQFVPSYSRASSFGEPATASPTASDYKRSYNGSFCSKSGTPPTGPESMRNASNGGIPSRASTGYGQSLERRLQEPEGYRDHHGLRLNPLQSSFSYHPAHELSTYPGAMRMNPLANPYTMPGYLGMSGLPSAPRFQIRESEHPQVVRSPLLEEFRINNKNNKRYELRDIYNHVVEFSGDQHGSRFIQQKLETANSDEKDQIFSEIQPNSLQLMTDVFGNYVIQKLFEHGNQSQKRLLANQMKGHVLSLSTQMYGCRVVQKALEHVLTDQQASLIKELENHVLKCVKDQNGNHVIQKAIERIPAEHIQFIIGAFTDQVQRLATHPYGCRVIQRMLEHCEESAKKSILQELHVCVPRLITDQFGNYVIQHVIENGEAEDKHSIVVVVLSQLLVFSKHKFASNVVEKSIEFAQEDQRSEILRRLTGQDENSESPVLGLMRDQYGNYVIRKFDFLYFDNANSQRRENPGPIERCGTRGSRESNQVSTGTAEALQLRKTNHRH